MRLTLRTLLAYMDGILDPADQEDLAKQVESSADAKELVHRARDAMRRRRLEAPTLGGGSQVEGDLADDPAFDANAVAEYLDNTAAPQSVVDFELECLKSDGQLAEVASCHQILTMVLGERAKIDPESRRRMYGIPELARALAAGEASAVDPHQQAPTDESVTEIPDYLRASNRSPFGRWMPAVAALLVLSFVSFLAFRDGGWLRTLKEPTSVVGSGSTGSLVDSNDSELPTPQGDAPVTPIETPPAEAPLAEESGDELPGEPPVGPQANDGGATSAPLVDALPSGVEPSGVETMFAGDANSASVGPLAAVDDETINKLPTISDQTQPPVVVPGAVSPLGVPRVGVAPEIASAVGPSSVAGLEPLGAAPPAPMEPLPVGLLSSPQEVLLRHTARDEAVEGDSAGEWRRLPVRAAVLTTDRLLSLPTYHPTVTLDSGLNVELVDGTLVEVGRTAPVNPPRIELVYGRLILTNTDGEPTQVVLAIGKVEAMLEIAARGVLAVESGRPFVAGVDPAKEQAPLQSTFFSPSGGIAWSSSVGDFTINGPSAWEIVGDSVGPIGPMTAEMVAEANWIDGRDLSAWESEATDDIEAQVVTGQPVWPQLMEIFGASRKEERALAAVSSSHVGHFDPFVRALGEEDLKPAWDDVIATLRASMARSPEAAAGVRQTLVDLRGEDRAANLYEMLCGYSQSQIGATPEQWATGSMRQLVDWLGSPHTEYRVLANYNLEQITGRKRVFNPVGLARTREGGVRRFQTRLEKGELVPQFAVE